MWGGSVLYTDNVDISVLISIKTILEKVIKFISENPETCGGSVKDGPCLHRRNLFARPHISLLSGFFKTLKFIYFKHLRGVSKPSFGVKEVVKLSKEEARALLRELRLRPWQLPWIRSRDPLVNLVGAKPGDIIKIVRESPTAGEIVVYRLVVPG